MKKKNTYNKMNNKLIICGKTEIIESEDGITTTELGPGVEIIEQIDDDDLSSSEKHGVQTVLAKFMEEKQTINYKKLVVPQSMRSIYWKFFGFPANSEGEILTRVKIVCLLCKTQIAYNRNTSNLRMHLQNKHSAELANLEMISPPRKQNLSPESKEKRQQKRQMKAAMANSRQHMYTTTADGSVQITGDFQFISTPNITYEEQVEEEDISNRPLKVLMNKRGYNESVDGQSVAFVIADDNQQGLNSSRIRKLPKESIEELVIIDLQPPDIVQESGFQRLVATLRSPCEIPSKLSLEEDFIPPTYNTFRETILSFIYSLNSEISLGIEEWKSNFGENFYTFLIYYQSPGDATLESKMLCTIHGPEEWGELQWINTVDFIFSDWHLKIDKVTAVVLSSDNTDLKRALLNKGLSVVPCLLHSLQVCAQTCYSYDQVPKVLRKCRSIIGWIGSHSDTAAELLRLEQDNELEKNAMVMDYPGVWTSTYTMIQQMILRREIISSLLNTERNNQMVSDLNEEEWSIINDLVEVLHPFTVTILTLSEEKMALVSLLKPLLWQLKTAHLKILDTDSDTAREFKEMLSNMLDDRYRDSNITLFFQIATTLDPRFKEVSYDTDENKKTVTKKIKELLTKLIEDYGDAGDALKVVESPVKKARLSGVERLFTGLCSKKNSLTSRQKADLEYAQYESEAAASLDNCPLQWWSKSSVKCPNLGVLANRYNCVPACCPPPQRIPAEMQIIYHAKRAALPSYLVDKLLFLHANYTFSAFK